MMFKRTQAYVDRLLCDHGPSSSRLINLGVFIVLSVAMIKLTWVTGDAVNMWYWACFTTHAVYGMGVATFNKWLDIIRAKVGLPDQPKP
jgi:hypothetical protein